MRGGLRQIRRPKQGRTDLDAEAVIATREAYIHTPSGGSTAKKPHKKKKSTENSVDFNLIPKKEKQNRPLSGKHL